MKQFTIQTTARKLLADTITPVSIYLRLRDVYPNSLLLESSDYHGNENSYSFICLKPLAGFEINDGLSTETYPDGSVVETEIFSPEVFKQSFRRFMNSFVHQPAQDVPVNGLFGYASYDAVRYFENISLNDRTSKAQKIPQMKYHFYNYIIAINHFQNILHIIENRINGEPDETERIETILNSRNPAVYNFRTIGDEQADITDEDYKNMVSKGKLHCHRGDVFQIVLSRQYSQEFLGDDFNVYRALRSVNPSPYLFYFDYGGFKIFGSSPEAHLKVSKGTANINPIAGTFRRTGDDERDKVLARQLAADLKENAEHVMLVDLARNDLSRYAEDVAVEKFREVQFFSHVIHLVSAVSGKLRPDSDIIDMMTATFPAGTLTGAPKFKAMQLIDEYEHQSRGYYGGAIGFLDFNGKFNHAIMIRTFLSTGNTLYYRAGAGIVAISDESSELQEVNNKLGALKKAIEIATTIK